MSMTLNDVAPLLAPIEGADPGGPDLRYDPVIDRIRELRREDDQRASRGIWIAKLKVADWNGAAELCAEVLAQRSKDLQVAGWLVEAVAARDGLGRLAHALEFLALLSEACWPVLWPRREPEDEDDPREAIFLWLDGRLAELAMQSRIAVQEGLEPTWQDRISALRLGPASDTKRARKPAEGRPPEMTIAVIDAAVERTGTEFYRSLAIHVMACRAALDRLKVTLSVLQDGRGASFSRFGGVLSAMAIWLRPLLLRRGIDTDQLQMQGAAPEAKQTPQEPPRPATEEDAPMPTDAAPIPAANGRISSRDEAYRMLEAVAGYLERTEPHSPVPLLVRRAISWGAMPLPQLLAELMQDPALTTRLLGAGSADEGSGQRRSR
jgi:type VI secretion system protein ImpA